MLKVGSMSGSRYIQGMLDFETGNPDGLENWRREQAEFLESIRKEWGLPIGRPVRIRLQNLDQEFEGQLELAARPPRVDRRDPLRLRLERMEFSNHEIESCAALD